MVMDGWRGGWEVGYAYNHVVVASVGDNLGSCRLNSFHVSGHVPASVRDSFGVGQNRMRAPS